MTDLRGNNGELEQGSRLVIELAEWRLRQRWLRAELPMKDQRVEFDMRQVVVVRLRDGDHPELLGRCRIMGFELDSDGIVRIEFEPWKESRN